MNTAFITTCTHTRTQDAIARVQDLPLHLTMSEALTAWTNLLAQDDRTTTAREFYRGIGFQTVIKIQETFKPNTIKIVTGGQGLIGLDDKIVPYDFSGDPKEDHNIQQHVTKEPFLPTLWWEGVNKNQGRGSHPVADVIEAHDLTVISMGKVFLRYCSSDVLSIPLSARNKLRILLAASSVGSVPAQLRPFIIPFDRGVIDHIPGNRNDGQHRAAFLFFQLMEEDPEFASLGVENQRLHFQDDVEDRKDADIESLLEDRPQLLKLEAEQAYKLLRREVGTLGGRMKFKSVFRKMRGEEFSVSSTEVHDAADILKNMNFVSSKPRAQDDEERSIAGVRVFLMALKSVAPDASFTPAHISSWAEQYYKKKQEETPSFIASPPRLVYLLKANMDALGIKETADKGFMINA